MNILKATLLVAAITGTLGACTTTTEKSGTRSMVQTIAAATVTGAVKSMLLADDQVKGMDITVKTEANMVTLSGHVTNTAARNQTIGLARNTRGVLGVRAKGLHSGN